MKKINATKLMKVWAVLCSILSLTQIAYGFFWLDCVVGAILIPAVTLLLLFIGDIDKSGVSDYLEFDAKELRRVMMIKYISPILLMAIFVINTAFFWRYNLACAAIQAALYAGMNACLVWAFALDLKKIQTAKKELKNRAVSF